MKDFEVHERGTAKELKLSRRLADVIAYEHEQNKTVPFPIMKAYNELYDHYMEQLEMERDR